MSTATELAPEHGLRAPISHALRFALWAALLLALLYAPYPADSIAVQWLTRYVALVARASAALLALGDPSVRLVDEVLITGRFPLQIVLDCTALDVQALYLAAVLSAPLRWRLKLAGALAGFVALGVINLARIVLLYWTGVHAPEHFDVMHEDVLTFALLVSACGCFWAFTRLAAR